MKSAPSLALLLLIIVLYYPSTGFDFAYDDLIVIQTNPFVLSSQFSFAHLSALFLAPSPPGDLYRPITIFSYWFDFLIQGLNPAWFHLTNIVLYGALTLAVYRLFQIFLPTREHAFWGTAVFAIHPIHIEAVANIVGRAELLAGFFGLTALLTYYSGLSKPLNEQRQYLALSSLLFLFAVLSKESALMFFPLTLGMGYFTAKENPTIPPPSRSLIRCYVSVILIGLMLRYLSLDNSFFVRPESSAMNPENPLLGRDFSERLIPALKILGDYVTNLFYPVRLSPDYSAIFPVLLSKTYSIAGLLSLFVVGALATAIYATPDRRLRFLGLWFFISFALTCNIFLPIGTIMADRLALVPSIGAIGFFVGHIRTSTPDRFFAVITPVLLCFCLVSSRQLPIWRNNGTLFFEMADINPDNPKALYNYGIYLFTHDNNHKEAEFYLQRVLEIVPDHLSSMKILADIALARQNPVQVEYWYRRILESYPDEAQVRKQLEQLNQLKYGGRNA